MRLKLRNFFKIIGYILLFIFILLILFVIYYYPGKSEAKKVEELTFAFHRDVIIIEATLNNSGPYNFVLDTGTDPSVIDINISDSLSLFQFSIGKQDVGEDQSLEILIPLPMKLQVGNLPSSRKLFLALDLKMISDKMEMPIHGILGHNFIKDNIIQIDYQKQKLKFYPFGINPYPNPDQNVKKMELHFIDDGTFPLVKLLSVNGKPINATIDTGSNQTLTLFRASVDYLGLSEVLESSKEIEAIGYGGAHKKKVMDSLTIKIDNWDIENSEVYFDLQSEKSKVSLDIRGGNLGNQILKNYILTLDYQNRIIWFEKK